MARSGEQFLCLFPFVEVEAERVSSVRAFVAAFRLQFPPSDKLPIFGAETSTHGKNWHGKKRFSVERQVVDVQCVFHSFDSTLGTTMTKHSLAPADKWDALWWALDKLRRGSEGPSTIFPSSHLSNSFSSLRCQGRWKRSNPVPFLLFSLLRFSTRFAMENVCRQSWR